MNKKIPPEVQAMFRDAVNKAVERLLRESDVALEIYFTGLRSGGISALVAFADMDPEEARVKARMMAEVASSDPIAREQLRETLIRTLNGEHDDNLVKINAYGIDRGDTL